MEESNTKLAAVLKGVVAFVEVRSSNDNRSAAIAHELMQLGARVETTFSDEVTHVVYKEGLKRTWIRATKRGVPMVSVSWLDSCKQHMTHMPESAFPAILPEESDSPLPRINHTTRWKKMRSMQPCDFEEEVARSAERGEKRRRRVMMANRFKLSEESTPNTSPIPILALETQPRFLMEAFSQTGSPVPDTPPSMKERLERMRREQMNVLQDESQTQTPKAPTEKPLQKRLFERLASDFASSNGTSSDDEADSADVIKQLIHRLDSDDGGNTSSSSIQNTVENPNKGLNFKPLTSPSIAKLQHSKLQSKSASSSAEPNSGKPNRRRSSRVSSSFSSISPKQSLHKKDKDTMKDSVSKHFETHKNDKVESSLQSMNTQSLPLSPKDVNVSAHSNKTKAIDPSNNLHCSGDLIKDTVHSPESNSTNHSSSKKVGENFEPKSTQRRRSCRISAKGKSSPDTNSSHSNQSALDMNKEEAKIPLSKSVKKKRNLYTQPDLNTSLPKPSVSKNSLTDSNIKISDVADSFGMSNDNSPIPVKNRNGKIKNRSAAWVSNNHEHLSGEKSTCDLTTMAPLSNRTLENSMSIMYGNDTTLPCEGRSANCRRSIDEFSSSKKAFKRGRSARVGERSKLDQIEESEQTEPASTSKSHQSATGASGKSKKVNTKRGRESGLSNDNAEATSSKRPKCSSSEGEDQFFSPHQPDHTQPRLRHARSLLLEPPESPSVKRVHYSIVVTSLHRHEQELVYSVLKKLGVFRLTNTVDYSSTHIICGEPRRTLNLLKAIARGCWVLSKEWVFHSLEAGAWLEEENFEMYKDLPVVKRSRLARHRAGDDYRVDLFSNVGPIFVMGGCKPPRKELIHLVQLCSGKVTGTQNKASICIGEYREPNKTIVKPAWILDSIMKLECLPVQEYIVPAENTSFSQRESSPEF